MNVYKPPTNQWIFIEQGDSEYHSVSFKSGLRESSPQLRKWGMKLISATEQTKFTTYGLNNFLKH